MLLPNIYCINLHFPCFLLRKNNQSLNITLNNVQLSLKAEDFRPEIVEEDVDGMKIEK